MLEKNDRSQHGKKRPTGMVPENLGEVHLAQDEWTMANTVAR
jgi:hypothetical protein